MNADRIDRRSFNNEKADAILELMEDLNRFCFHDSEADSDCGGCSFQGYTPCPLAVFYDKLEGVLK